MYIVVLGLSLSALVHHILAMTNSWVLPPPVIVPLVGVSNQSATPWLCVHLCLTLDPLSRRDGLVVGMGSSGSLLKWTLHTWDDHLVAMKGLNMVS